MDKILSLMKEGGPDAARALKAYLQELPPEDAWSAAHQWARHLGRETEGELLGVAYQELEIVHHYAAFRDGKRAIDGEGLTRPLDDIRNSGAGVSWRLFLMHGLLGAWDTSQLTLLQKLRIVDTYLALARSTTEAEVVRLKALAYVCTHLERLRESDTRADGAGMATQERQEEVGKRTAELARLTHALLGQRSTPHRLKFAALEAYVTATAWLRPPQKPSVDLIRTIAWSYADFPEKRWPELLRESLGVLPEDEVETLHDGMLNRVEDNFVAREILSLWGHWESGRDSRSQGHQARKYDHVKRLLKLSTDDPLWLGDEKRRYLHGLDREAGWQATRDWARYMEKMPPDARDTRRRTTLLLIFFEHAVLKGDEKNLQKADIDRAFSELTSSTGRSLWRRFLLFYIADKWGERTTSTTEKMRILDCLLGLAADKRDHPQLRAEALKKAAELLELIHDASERVQNPTPALQEERKAMEQRVEQLVQLGTRFAKGVTTEPQMVVPGLQRVVHAQFLLDLPKTQTPALVSTVLESYARLPEAHWPTLIEVALLVIPKADVQDAYDGMRRTVKSKDTLRALELVW